MWIRGIAMPPIGLRLLASSATVVLAFSLQANSAATHAAPSESPRLVVETDVGTSPLSSASPPATITPFGVVPYEGTVSTPVTGTYDSGSGTGAAAGNRARFVPRSADAAPILITADSGAWLSTSASLAWDGGVRRLTASSGTAIFVYALTIGNHEVTFESGGERVVATYRAYSPAAAAYSISLSAPLVDPGPRESARALLAIHDVFGNRVPGSSSGQSSTNTVTVSVSGEILLDGFAVSRDFTPGADGTSEVSFITGASDVGVGTLTARPSPGANVPAWQENFVPFPGAEPPATTARVQIGVGPAAPSPPRAVEAFAVPGGVNVTWQEPTSSGASRVASYTATANPGGHRCTSTKKLDCMLTDLRLNTSYEITVTAMNTLMPSRPSEPIWFDYELRPPGAPWDLAIVGGDRTATATWQSPRDTGGLEISGFTVSANPGGASCSTTGDSANTCAITGLENGIPYTFTVSAINDLGQSEPSAETGPVVLGTVPSRPRIRSVDQRFVMHWGRLRVQVKLRFSPPSDPGDGVVTGYQVGTRYSGKIDFRQGTCNKKRTSCTIIIDPAQVAKLVVTASNAYGESEPSATRKVRGLVYEVTVRGESPGSMNASSLATGPASQLKWAIYDPMHILESFAASSRLSGRIYSTIPTNTWSSLRRSDGVRRTTSGWEITTRLAYLRLDRGVCYGLRDGVRNSLSLNLSASNAYPGGDPDESEISWIVRCSDW